MEGKRSHRVGRGRGLGASSSPQRPPPTLKVALKKGLAFVSCVIYQQLTGGPEKRVVALGEGLSPSRRGRTGRADWGMHPLFLTWGPGHGYLAIVVFWTSLLRTSDTAQCLKEEELAQSSPTACPGTLVRGLIGVLP